MAKSAKRTWWIKGKIHHLTVLKTETKPNFSLKNWNKCFSKEAVKKRFVSFVVVVVFLQIDRMLHLNLLPCCWTIKDNWMSIRNQWRAYNIYQCTAITYGFIFHRLHLTASAHNKRRWHFELSICSNIRTMINLRYFQFELKQKVRI